MTPRTIGSWLKRTLEVTLASYKWTRALTIPADASALNADHLIILRNNAHTRREMELAVRRKAVVRAATRRRSGVMSIRTGKRN